MDRQYIDDNNIIDRYLMDQLSADEASAFEMYYFEHPEILEELTIARALRDGLRDEQDRLRPSTASEPGIGWFEALFQPKLGFAISALLAIAVAGLSFQLARITPDPIYTVPPVTLSDTRSGAVDRPVLRFSETQESVLLTLELGPIGYKTVELHLSDENQRTIWQDRVPVEGPVGVVSLIVATTQLPPAGYKIDVYPPQGGDEVLNTFEFEVQRR